MIALASGFERVSQHPPIRAEQLLRLAEDKAFVIEAAVRDLGYAPRPFADGIRAEARAMGLAPVTGTDLVLLARTAAHLRPGQVAHRARLRAQRTALRRWPQVGRRLLAGPDPAPRSAGRSASGHSTRAGRWTRTGAGDAGTRAGRGWPSCGPAGSRCSG